MFVYEALFLALIQNVFCGQLLVKSKAGSFLGVKAADGDYTMFLGIPYAKVDPANPFGGASYTDALVALCVNEGGGGFLSDFKKKEVASPQPVFDYVFEANDDSVKCIQLDFLNNNEVIGTLDCLRLSIYVPDTAINPLPVMVWIHGGAFFMGSGNMYRPKYLVRHDVIIVTINYRLGLHGFMCLDIPEVPGNQGLKDQLAALRWIKDNIESFGGDVNKITLFGESAGARFIDFHLMSHQEKLFHQVIMESGTALIGDTVSDANPGAAFTLAKQLGFSTPNVYDALSFLALNVSSADVVIAARDTGLLNTTKVCVEKQFENVEDFVLDYPVNSKIPKAVGTPILIGYNDNEQLYEYAEKSPSYFYTFNVIEDLLKSNFDFFDTNQLKDMEEIVRRFYLYDERVDDQRSIWDIIDFDSDISKNYPIEWNINKLIENGADTIYHYVFSYVGGLNFKNFLNIKVGGASHGDEVAYLFTVPNVTDTLTATPEDLLVVDRMTTMWTNFAKYGNPTPLTTHILPVIWQPVTAGERFYLNISSTLNIQKNPFHKRMAFWELFYRLNFELLKGYNDVNYYFS